MRPTGLIESRPATSKLSISDFSILRPPMPTSTLATVLTSPPAEKPTKAFSTLVPAIRSACSTASRMAASVRSMSATKPRLTPRLSRWPVPRMRSSPASPGSAIRAETLDEPMSRAVTSLRPGGCGILLLNSRPSYAGPSYGRRRVDGGRGGRRGLQFGYGAAGDVGHADDDLAGNAHVEPHEAAPQELGRLVHPREMGERLPCRLDAFGQGQRLPRLEPYVPTATANPGGAGEQRPQLRRVREQRDKLFGVVVRSEEHTSELQSLMRNSYAVF